MEAIIRIGQFNVCVGCGPSDRDGTLTVEVKDGGGGEYLVIHAKHWAMDGQDEIAELVKVFTTMLAK